MNAIEARELSKQNEISKARSELQEVIQRLEFNIEIEAKRGNFQALVVISPSDSWMNFNCSNDMVWYFEKKGFKFKTIDYLNGNIGFICSW